MIGHPERLRDLELGKGAAFSSKLSRCETVSILFMPGFDFGSAVAEPLDESAGSGPFEFVPRTPAVGVQRLPRRERDKSEVVIHVDGDHSMGGFRIFCLHQDVRDSAELGNKPQDETRDL